MIGKPTYGAAQTVVGTDTPLRSFYTVPGFLPPTRMGGGADTWLALGGGHLAPRDAYGQSGAVNAVGWWFEWDMPLRPQWKTGAPVFGQNLGFAVGPNLAKFTLQWDGIQYGNEIDSYAAAYSFTNAYMGLPVHVYDYPGLHTFRITITGKHASSTGMYLLISNIGYYDIPA